LGEPVAVGAVRGARDHPELAEFSSRRAHKLPLVAVSITDDDQIVLNQVI